MATEPHPRIRSTSDSKWSEAGSGLLSSVFGLAIVAATIGLAANVAIGLWIRSTVDSVAHDAATHVALADPPLPAGMNAIELERSALRKAHQLLGDYGDDVVLEFIDSGDPSVVALRVRAPGMRLLPRMINGGPVVGAIDRVILVRREGS